MSQKIIKRGGRNTASLVSKNGRLSIRFSKNIFGHDKWFALGLDDCPDNYPKAKSILGAICADIYANKFDFSLKDYSTNRKSYCKNEGLLTVFKQYLEGNKYRWKERTYYYLSHTIQRWVSDDFDVDDSFRFREFLLENTTESMAKRVLTNVSAAMEWWSRKTGGLHSFRGSFKGLKHNYERFSYPRPFLESEVDMIFSNIKNHSFYAHYLDFSKFLFSTGCRPSEAVGLTWDDIYPKYIFFRGSLSVKEGKEFVSRTSKTGKQRRFPINDNVKEILFNQKENINEYVFSKPSGGRINYEHYRGRVWKKCAQTVVPKSTPYNARDTFITNQLKAGVPPAYIAKWCDTSISMIEKFYFLADDSFLPV